MPLKTEYQDILYTLTDGVARITLNRPDHLNGLTRQMRGELIDAFKRTGADARAILLSGAGDHFCAGEDMGGDRHAAEMDLEHLVRDEYGPLLTAIEAVDAPIIAAVNGVAAGTGANLALACDVVVAGRSATFCQSFSRIGLLPAMGGTFNLPRLVGLPRAMGMALFAEDIPAPQAAEWGLIWEVVSDADLSGHADDLAARLAAGPTRAYAAIRKSMRRGLSQPLDAQLAVEAEEQGRLARTRDFAEGVGAFLTNRDPDFEGR